MNDSVENTKLWGGRFTRSTDKLVEQFNASIDVDKRLYDADIEGSIAHLKMMANEGIIPKEEAGTLIEGLGKVKRQIENHEMEFTPGLEDIHMHVEDALTKVSGDVAKKLHTGRSRNDQVALDVRIYLKKETLLILELLSGFQKVLVKMARKHLDVIMPGYTHLQRAQPILFSHYLMAYYEMLCRDIQRFEDCLKRIDVMPLGAAALAGTTYPLNREFTRQVLSFSSVSQNSIDSVSDRDFVMEFISHASICMIHLSRLSEELILWSSAEFSFITISDAFTTGSSIMPQKKNPDVAELVRGKTGRVVGNLMSILMLMKSLPLAYNKDMQEDKEPLFDTVDTLKICLEVYTRMFENIKIHKDRMLAACSQGFLNATDLADYLVAKGMPFRQAHAVAGKAVAYALENQKELDDLSLEEFKTLSDLIGKDVYDAIAIHTMISKRISYGGTSFDNVTRAVEKAEKNLGLK
ncbi:MAG: argininosuccinate lyase [Proteobacteria bacterium]|nr:argininosuccinate lyase [Pseudomonadota bacterium]MBU1388803.1 argininosuccinate lyase [Pseudomonadota bacterium]MBU1543144.1 argininosuccinate lyase [Pseudomonadota bacterium]MBU2482595.1 argininosuccinate lyase [Pseudomonadota bacterium]